MAAEEEAQKMQEEVEEAGVLQLMAWAVVEEAGEAGQPLLAAEERHACWEVAKAEHCFGQAVEGAAEEEARKLGL